VRYPDVSARRKMGKCGEICLGYMSSLKEEIRGENMSD